MENTTIKKRRYGLSQDRDQRRIGFMIGMIIAMIATLTAFNWKTPTPDVPVPVISIGDEIDEDPIPITIVKRKIEPKVKKVVVRKSVELKSKEFKQEITKDISKLTVSKDEGLPDPVFDDMFEPELTDEHVVDNTPFVKVERFPAFKGCEHIVDADELEKCTAYEIRRFIASNLSYPRSAKRNDADGTVYMSFIVERDGSVSNVEILKGVEGEKSLGIEAKRLLEMLPTFKPGEQRGRKVRVKYNIPITFKLR